MVACKNLKNLDLLSKSDPKCIVYLRTNNTSAWTRIGVTETIKDNLNPDFTTLIPIFYQFERHQYLKFEIIDVDSETEFEVIGSAETTLGKIAGSLSFS